MGWHASILLLAGLAGVPLTFPDVPPTSAGPPLTVARRLFTVTRRAFTAMRPAFTVARPALTSAGRPETLAGRPETNALRPRLAAHTHGAAQPLALDALHHLPHLGVLLEQAVDLGHRGAGAHGDALLAAAVQDIRTLALSRRHRVDDRLDALEAALVHAGGVEAAQGAHLRQHLQDRGERPQLLELPELVAQILEGELLADDALGQALRLGLVEAALGLLDERQHVAHADHPRGHALGVEQLEVVRLLADAHEADGHLGDGADRQGGAAAGVAVELGEDDAGQGEHLGELLGALDRVLAGHRVGHEEDLVRLDAAGELADLFHQRRVDVETAGGVHDHDVVAALAGDGQRPGAEVHHVLARLGLEHRHVDALAHLLQLLDGGGALKVARHQQRMLAALFQALGDLAGGGRLARALEAAEHEHRRPAVEAQLGALLAEQGGELVAHDLDHLLGRREALEHLLAQRALAHPLDEGLDHPEVDVGLEQRHPDLAQRRVEGLGRDPALALELAEDVLELILQTVEHGKKDLSGCAAGMPRILWGNGMVARRNFPSIFSKPLQDPIDILPRHGTKSEDHGNSGTGEPG